MPMKTGLKTSGGEGGIRTLGTGVSPYNGLANRRIRPLCHLSGLEQHCDCRWKSGVGAIIVDAMLGALDHKERRGLRSFSGDPLVISAPTSVPGRIRVRNTRAWGERMADRHNPAHARGATTKAMHIVTCFASGLYTARRKQNISGIILWATPSWRGRSSFLSTTFFPGRGAHSAR